jgi:transcriptional regulator of acetoin/glycerol metabolism
MAWRRARLAGLAPSTAVDRLAQAEVDPRSRLVQAAAPVLDELAEQLQGSGYCLLLADRDARIVERRWSGREVDRVLDSLSAVPGTQYLESTTGTNSIATVHELRRGVEIRGEEHFLESMRSLSCYGHPVTDPATRRFEGVLDITGPATETSSLLAPLVVRACREIEQRLLEGSRVAQKHLLAAYQQATAHAVDPVVVFGDGVLLANPAAVGRLSPRDYVVLRDLTEDLPLSGTASTGLTLTSGLDVEARVQAVAGAATGALVRLRTRLANRAVTARPRAGAPTATAVLVTGEPGTGRTTRARALAGPDAPVVECARAGDDDVPRFARRLEAALDGAGEVVLEDVHLLPDAVAARLRRRLTGEGGARVVATSAPAEGVTGEQAALLAAFGSREPLAPLRADRPRVPGLVADVLAEHGCARTPDPALVQALLDQPWPGNLTELRRVAAHLAAAPGPPAAPLTPADLPATHAAPRRARRARTPLERSEAETITDVLAACGGNKVRAARELGISRATLYTRLRRLGIDGSAP